MIAFAVAMDPEILEQLRRLEEEQLTSEKEEEEERMRVEEIDSRLQDMAERRVHSEHRNGKRVLEYEHMRAGGVCIVFFTIDK